MLSSNGVLVSGYHGRLGVVALVFYSRPRIGLGFRGLAGSCRIKGTSSDMAVSQIYRGTPSSRPMNLGAVINACFSCRDCRCKHQDPTIECPTSHIRRHTLYNPREAKKTTKQHILKPLSSLASPKISVSDGSALTLWV